MRNAMNVVYIYFFFFCDLSLLLILYLFIYLPKANQFNVLLENYNVRVAPVWLICSFWIVFSNRTLNNIWLVDLKTFYNREFISDLVTVTKGNCYIFFLIIYSFPLYPWSFAIIINVPRHEHYRVIVDWWLVLINVQ